MKKKFLAVVATVVMTAMLAACGTTGNGETTPTPTPTTAPEADTPDVPEIAPKDMISNIHQAIQEAYGEGYMPSVELDEYFMTETLKLDSSWYDAAFAEGMMMAVIPDTLVLVHPTEGNLENVQKALEAYKETLASNAWYPTTVIRAQGAVTGTVGEYVYFVVLTGSVDDMMYEEEADMIAACIENTKLAVETIEGVISGDIVVVPLTDIQKIYKSIRSMYSDSYYPDTQVQDWEEYMTETLKLDASWYTDAIVEIPGISAGADKLVLIKASEGNLENVQKALEAFRDNEINNTFQYPMNLTKVQSAVVETVGDYVVYSVLGGTIDEADWPSYGITSNEELIEVYQTRNSYAVWAIREYLGLED